MNPTQQAEIEIISFHQIKCKNRNENKDGTPFVDLVRNVYGNSIVSKLIHVMDDSEYTGVIIVAYCYHHFLRIMVHEKEHIDKWDAIELITYSSVQWLFAHDPVIPIRNANPKGPMSRRFSETLFIANYSTSLFAFLLIF